MKINYNIERNKSMFDFEKWFNKITKDIEMFKIETGLIKDVYNEYLKISKEFKNYLSTSDIINDINGINLNVSDIYNSVNLYKIRIEKLLLMLNMKVYRSYNINKLTGVRYVVMRSSWIDNQGKSYRYFSRNLGAENKVLVNGEIPHTTLNSVNEYIHRQMWDYYRHEYDLLEFGNTV